MADQNPSILMGGPVGSKLMYVATAISLLGAFSMGCAQGWSSSVMPQFMGPDALPLGVSDPDTRAWISSILNLGGLFGGLVAGTIANLAGRRMGIFLMCIPYIASWGLIIFGQSVGMLLAGRVLTGAFSAMYTSLVPMYVAEIATPEIRGMLGSGFETMCATGLFYATVIGLNVPWRYFSAACVIPILALAVGILFMPESPVFLVSRQKVDLAKKCLTRLRKPISSIDQELDATIQSFGSPQPEGTAGSVQRSGFMTKIVDLIVTLRRPDAWKPFILAMLVSFFQLFSGVSSIVFFQKDIFLGISATLDADLATLGVVVVQMVGTIIAAFSVDRFGRKLLLLISSTAHMVSLAVLGAFYYCKLNAANPEEFAAAYSWIPVACMAVFFAGYALGWGPLAWILTAELAPNFIRGEISSVSMGWNAMCGFMTTRYFGNLQTAVGSHGAFWFYAIINGVSIPFVIFCLPETRGKSLEEIQEFYTSEKVLLPESVKDRIDRQLSTGSGYRIPAIRSISVITASSGCGDEQKS